jgi:hypothetical protein
MRWLERYLAEDSSRLRHFAEIVASLALRDPDRRSVDRGARELEGRTIYCSGDRRCCRSSSMRWIRMPSRPVRVQSTLGKAPAFAGVESAAQLEFDEVALRSSLLPKLSRA